ncbi:MAG: hypothetical protein ACI90V_008843, partial [Bacillariaceae sp.]
LTEKVGLYLAYGLFLFLSHLRFMRDWHQIDL